MQPDDVNDLIIAMILVVLLASVVWALQSPIGKTLTSGLNREAEINSNYNFSLEESIFLTNYLRTPIYESKVTIADYILMCDDEGKFENLKKETEKITRGYDREINIIVRCKNEKKIVLGDLLEDEKGTGLFFNSEKGVEVKIYSKGTLGLSRVSSYSKPFGG